MKRIIAHMLGAFVAVNSMCFAGALNYGNTVYAINEDTIYEENFDNWIDGNIFSDAAALDGKGYYTSESGNGVVGIYSSMPYDENGNPSILEAVADPSPGASTRGKVLKYANNIGNGQNKNGDFLVRLGADASTIDLSGCVIKLEYDFFLPESTSSEQDLPNNVLLPVLGMGASYNDILPADAEGCSDLRIAYPNGIAGAGVYGASSVSNAQRFAVRGLIKYTKITTGKWHNVKILYRIGGDDATPDSPDTWRVYFDGALVQGQVRYSKSNNDKLGDVYDYLPTKYAYGVDGGAASSVYDPNNSFSGYKFATDFYGINFGGFGLDKSHNVRAIYLDDIKVSVVGSEFKVNDVAFKGSKDEFVVGGNNIAFELSCPVDESMLDYVGITDSNGNTVEGAIKTRTLSNEGKLLEISLDSAIVESDASYSVVFPKEFTDEYGQSLGRYYSTTRSAKENEGTNFYNPDIQTSSTYTGFKFKTAKLYEVSVPSENVLADTPIELRFSSEVQNVDTLLNSLSLYDINNGFDNKKRVDCTFVNSPTDLKPTNIVVNLQRGNLRWDNKYALCIETNEITDIYGMKIPAGSYEFSTAKSDGISIDSDNSSIAEGIYNLQLNKAADDELICIFAEYAADGKLTCIQLKKISPGNDKENFTISGNSGVTYKVYLYSSNNGEIGKMLQRPEEL